MMTTNQDGLIFVGNINNILASTYANFDFIYIEPSFYVKWNKMNYPSKHHISNLKTEFDVLKDNIYFFHNEKEADKFCLEIYEDMWQINNNFNH